MTRKSKVTFSITDTDRARLVALAERLKVTRSTLVGMLVPICLDWYDAGLRIDLKRVLVLLEFLQAERVAAIQGDPFDDPIELIKIAQRRADEYHA